MKKLIVLVMLLFSFFSSISQVRLQYTAEEIKSEFKGIFEVNEDYLDDGTYYITVWTAKSAVIHLFMNKSDQANRCVVIPYTKADLNYYVEQYNRKYVIVSDTQWKMYTENGLCNIWLDFEGEMGAKFIWE